MRDFVANVVTRPKKRDEGEGEGEKSFYLLPSPSPYVNISRYKVTESETLATKIKRRKRVESTKGDLR